MCSFLLFRSFFLSFVRSFCRYCFRREFAFSLSCSCVFSFFLSFFLSVVLALVLCFRLSVLLIYLLFFAIVVLQFCLYFCILHVFISLLFLSFVCACFFIVRSFFLSLFCLSCFLLHLSFFLHSSLPVTFCSVSVSFFPSFFLPMSVAFFRFSFFRPRPAAPGKARKNLATVWPRLPQQELPARPHQHTVTTRAWKIFTPGLKSERQRGMAKSAKSPSPVTLSSSTSSVTSALSDSWLMAASTSPRRALHVHRGCWEIKAAHGLKGSTDCSRYPAPWPTFEKASSPAGRNGRNDAENVKD